MEYKIDTGNLVTVSKSIWNGELKIMYCGMPNESTFVLAPLLSHNPGYSPNIYYSIANTVIHFLGAEFNVYEVHPDYIVIGDG